MQEGVSIETKRVKREDVFQTSDATHESHAGMSEVLNDSLVQLAERVALSRCCPLTLMPLAHFKHQRDLSRYTMKSSHRTCHNDA